MDTTVDPAIKLRAPSHWLRLLGFATAAAVLGGGLWAFESFSNEKDAAQLSRFERFRAVYAEKCGVPDFAGPVPEIVNQTYLTSPAIRLTMDKQLGALEEGAYCEDVAQALKRVDFVVPRPPVM